MPEPETLQETVIGGSAAAVALSLSDVQAIREEILAFLGNSDLGDRDLLIGLTTNLPATIATAGTASAGGWMLQMRGGDLVAVRYISTSAVRAVGYTAVILAKDGRWLVARMEPTKVRFR